MDNPAFIYRLKRVLPEDCLPWVLTALRHEATIWECLQRPDFQEQLFLQDGSQVDTWSPASIALATLPKESGLHPKPGESAQAPAERLRMDLQYPLETGLRRRAARTFEIYVAHPVTDSPDVMPLVDNALYRLTQAALLALALRERRRLLGSWEGLGAELCRSLNNNQTQFPAEVNRHTLTGHWGLPLACLYGMIPDPLELLKSLLAPCALNETAAPPTHAALGGYTHDEYPPSLVVHILLSNPIPKEKLLSIFRSLLAGLTLKDGVGLLTCLSDHRPEMSALLAQDLLNLRCGQCMGNAQGNSAEAGQNMHEHPQPCVPERGTPAEYLKNLERQLLEAAAHRLAGQSLPSLAHLNAAWEASYRLQAELAAHQAMILQESGEGELSLPAWKQAVELAPDNTHYLASMIRSLWVSGRPEDAAEQLQNLDDRSEDGPSHPLIALTNARIAARQAKSKDLDIEKARQLAISALEAFEDKTSTGSEPEIQPYRPAKRNRLAFLKEMEELIDLLLDLNLPFYAAEACQVALHSYPSNPGLIASLGLAQFQLGRLEEAAQTTQLAAAIEPEKAAIRRQLATCLESLGRWTDALPERMAVLDLIEEENLDDLHALAKCALLSGEADQAAEACRKAIDMAPENGQAHAMLGEALLMMGDPEAAEKHFQAATQYVPAIAPAWLALARLQKEFGRPAQAMETLKAGAMAATDSPEIYLELGEAYLDDWEGKGLSSPTQALTMFQNAARLAAHTQVPASFSGEIGLKLGQTLFMLGHTKEARRALEKTYAEHPEHPGLAEALAETLVAVGDLQAAVPVLRRVVENYPEDNAGDDQNAARHKQGVAARLELARALVSLKIQPEEAVRCLEYVLRDAAECSVAEGSSPESGDQEPLEISSEVHALLAEALALCKDYPAALQAYQLALAYYSDPAKRSDSDLAWTSRLSIGLGEVALILGQPEIAIAALEEAGQADPNNPQIARTLCSAYHAAGLDDEALSAARQAIRLAPADVEILAWFAETVTAINQEGDASSPRTDNRSEPGQLSIEALNAFTRAIQLAPHRSDLLIRYGKVQLAAGEKEEAVETFRAVASEELASAAELHQAGLILLEMGEAESAAAALEKALHLRGKEAFQEPILESIPYSLILALHRSKDPQAALAILEQARAAAPGETSLRQLQAELLVELGRSSEALACIEEAIEQDREGDRGLRLHFQAAQIARAAGKLQNALSHLNAIIESEGTTLGPTASPQQSETARLRAAARTLAADLSRALLKPEEALDYLAVLPEGEELDPSDSDQKYSAASLRLELALDKGDKEAIARAAAALFNKAGEPDERTKSPRLEAIRTRLLLRRGERRQALNALEDACRMESGLETAGDLYAISQAALELSQWETAISFGRQALEKAPEEPLFHFHLASSLLLQAEAVRIGCDLEMAGCGTNSPALSEQRRISFEEYLEGAGSRLTGGHSPSNGAGRTPLLASTYARGKAAWQYSTTPLSSLVSYTLGPEDIAAQIAALRGPKGTGNKNGAGASLTTQALQAAQPYPQHPLVLAQLALTLEAGGEHPQEALTAAREAVKTFTDGVYILPALGEQPEALLYALLARTAYTAGDLEMALHASGTALASCPKEPAWHALAARIRTVCGDFEQAVEHLEQAVDLAPDNYEYFLSLGNACLLVPSIEGHYSARAIEALEKAAALAPDAAEAWMPLAEAYRKAGDLEKAASCCERAIELAPGQAAPLVLRAEIALQAGEPQEAIDRLQAATIADGESADLEDLHSILLTSRALDNLNRPAEALEALEKALPRAQEPLPLLLERVRLLQRTTGLPAAIEALKEIAQHYPEEPVVLAYLAKAQAEDGQTEASTANAQRALQLAAQQAPLGDPLLALDVESQAEMHLLLGRLLRHSGQLDQALYHLNASIEKNPRLLDPYLELGRVLQERRQVSQALQVYNRASSIAPRDPRPYFQAGLALKEGKDYMGAEAMFRRAASLAPNDLGIHRQLGAVVALNLVHNRRRSTLDV